jgi:flagellar protein FlaG
MMEGAMDIASTRGASLASSVADRTSPAVRSTFGDGAASGRGSASYPTRTNTIDRNDPSLADLAQRDARVADALAEALAREGFGPETMGTQVKLAIDIDTNTGDLVGRLIDRTTGETVEQLPPEKTLKMIAALREMVGALVDRTL